jgi:hypothetical protein
MVGSKPCAVHLVHNQDQHGWLTTQVKNKAAVLRRRSSLDYEYVNFIRFFGNVVGTEDGIPRIQALSQDK